MIDDLIDAVIDREGGFVNNPADRGGATRFGVTDAVARANGYTGDMRHFARPAAVAIYRRLYWTAPGLDRVAVGDDVDLEPVRRVRDALRSVEHRVGVRLAEVGELVGRPVVGVLVGHDDGVDVVQVDQGSGERAGVDDELAPVLLDDEAGVFEFREAHEADCTPAAGCRDSSSGTGAPPPARPRTARDTRGGLDL